MLIIYDNVTPLVSIIVLTYNKFDGFYDTIQSIVKQEYKNYELIISDDHSTNFPMKDVKEILQNIFRVKYRLRINAKNVGITSHANIVAKMSEGEYIKFLSPGDGFCTEKSLTHLVKRATENHDEVLTSPCLTYKTNIDSAKYMFPSKKRLKKLINKSPNECFSELSRGNILSAAGTIYHKSFFENGGFDEKYRNLDDWPMWLSRFRQNKVVDIMELPTVYYRLNGISNENGNAFRSEVLHNDMLLCFKEEILPYRDRLTFFVQWIVDYHYEKLTGNDVGIKIKYIPLELYYRIKQKIKGYIV